MLTLDKLLIAAVMFSISLTQELPVAEIYHDTGGVLEGKETSFFCLINNMQNQQQVIQFSHNNITISENTKVIGEKSHYNVVKAGQSFPRFYLTLSAALIDDSGQYGCHVVASAEDPTVLSSDYVSLSVFHLPSDQYPVCASQSHTESLTFIEGDDITVTCRSASGQPPISLTWDGLGGSTIISSSTSISDGVISNKLILQPKDGATVMCRLVFDKEIFVDEPPRNCTIGDFSIISKPVVRVQPLHSIVREGGTAQFQCLVTQVPDFARVTRKWFTYPNIPANRLFISADKTIALINNISEADNKTVINCKVSTVLASVEATSMLTVAAQVPLKVSTQQSSTEAPLPSSASSQNVSSTTSGNMTTLQAFQGTASDLGNRQNSSLPSDPRGSTHRKNATKTTTNPNSASEEIRTEISDVKTTSASVNQVEETESMIGGRHEQSKDTCSDVTDNYLPYILAILVAVLVSFLALVADILLLLKLFQRNNVAQLK